MRPLTALLIALLLACAGARFQALPSVHSPLPAPSGPFAVGTRIPAPLVDTSRPDERFARGVRTVPLQVWYPAAAATGTLALQLPDPAVLDAMKAESTAPAKLESWRSLRVHAYEDAPALPGRYPLVLFSPGFGMSRSAYTSWIEELASQGFVVAALDHPFAGLAHVDGRVLPATPHPEGPGAQSAAMAADLRIALDALLARSDVDATRVAVVGHSIGGIAALLACKGDARVDACVNLDGDPSLGNLDGGVGKPFLVVHQDPDFPHPGTEFLAIGRELERSWQTLVAR